jgi:hypothetical protein
MKVNIGPYKDDDSEREIDVVIEGFDTWSMDSTLAYIVLPMLKQLKATKYGSPIVDEKDVLEHLRSTKEEKEHLRKTGEVDDKFFARWDWVKDEMIFAFESVHDAWEDQFYSGESDHIYTPVDVHGEDDVSEKKPAASWYRIDNGPNHTFKIDEDGLNAYQTRIENGFRLFGKYFTSLWD